MGQARAKQLVDAGLWLRLSGDHEGAARLFEQALKLDPNNQKARQYLEHVPGPAGTRAGTAPTPPPVAPLRVGTGTNPFIRVDPPSASGPSPGAAPVEPGSWGEWTPPPPEKRLARDAKSAWDTESNPGIQVPSRLQKSRDALDLVDEDVRAARPATPPPAPPPAPARGAEDPVEALLRGVSDLLELDDHSGAMELLVKAHELAPNDPRVVEMRAHSERTLLSMLEGKLGDLQSRPRVRLQEDDVIWLNLDHRAGFVLAQIDGTVSYDDIYALSGMSRLDTARILVQLLEEGVIAAS